MKEKFVFYTVLALIAGIVPFVVSSSQLDLFIRALLLACAALGLQLLMSYAGQISLGHAAFMGVAAYISGILSVRYELPSVLTIFLAVGATVLMAFIVGFPLLRLRGYYLAIGTLAFGLAVTALINALYGITGGPNGLLGIPNIGWGEFEVSDRTAYYFVSVSMFAGFYWYASNLVKSRIGRALVTLKGDENAAEAMGISSAWLKLRVFVISAIFAALAGAVMGHYFGLIVPTQFDILISVELLIIIILGGETALIGSLVGAFIWVYMSEFAQSFDVPRQIIIGVIIVLLILFFRGGVSPTLLSLYEQAKERLRSNKSATKDTKIRADEERNSDEPS